MPSKQKAGYDQHASHLELNSDHSNRRLTSTKIFNVLWSLKKKGLSKYTIRNYSKSLRFLDKHCNLDDPESVKSFIARYETSNSYKRNLVLAYEHYRKQYGLEWEKPKYWIPEKLPRIPLERKIDMIISAASRKLALKLLISKETGSRPIEIVNLKVRDIDLEKGLIFPATAKHGSPRVLKLKTKTITLLKEYIRTKQIELNEKIFGNETAEYYGKAFRNVRNKVAKKLNDVALKSIRLYDLRHFYATMLYHKTKDILFVKQKLGHKKLQTTLRYTQLINFESDEYTVRVASSLEECTKLLETGFEYVTNYQDKKIFRKRK